jgi:hypothetical protein
MNVLSEGDLDKVNGGNPVVVIGVIIARRYIVKQIKRVAIATAAGAGAVDGTQKAK